MPISAPPFWSSPATGAPLISVGLSGASGTGSVGTLSPSLSGGTLSIALTGVYASGASGILLSQSSLLLSGNSGVGSTGTLTGVTSDHTPGDGLTRLQSTFAGASAADVSGFNVPVTQTGGSLQIGYYDLSIAVGDQNNPGLHWDDIGIARPSAGSAYTVEAFVALISYPTGDNSDSHTHISMNNLTSNMTGGSNPIQLDTVGGYVPTNFVQDGAYYANWNASGDPTPGLIAQIRHVAWVWYTDDTYAEYYNGVRQAGPTADSGHYLGSPTPQILFGSASASAYWCHYTMRYYGIRVRRASMYSGASFAAPASPSAWGPP